MAEFYWKRQGWRGSAGRWMTIADTYGDLQGGKTHGEALWQAAQAWRNARDPANEKAALQRLIQEAPGSPHRRDAEQMLKELPVAAQPAQPPAAEPGKPASPPPTAPAPAEKPPPADQPPQPTPPGAQPNR